MTTDAVYHFTNTARLPWILQGGELRPGANRVGGYPDPEFLWAIADERGAPSASVNLPGYRKGLQIVRFTLHADDFEVWREIVRRFPAWTPSQIERLEKAKTARNCSPALWRCRVEPLPRSRWIEIATKDYTDHAWRSLSPLSQPLPSGAGTLGLIIGGRTYLSRRSDPKPGQAMSYEFHARDMRKLG
jgi:hypothetical protein